MAQRRRRSATYWRVIIVVLVGLSAASWAQDSPGFGVVYLVLAAMALFLARQR